MSWTRGLCCKREEKLERSSAEEVVLAPGTGVLSPNVGLGVRWGFAEGSPGTEVRVETNRQKSAMAGTGIGAGSCQEGRWDGDCAGKCLVAIGWGGVRVGGGRGLVRRVILSPVSLPRSASCALLFARVEWARGVARCGHRNAGSGLVLGGSGG